MPSHKSSVAVAMSGGVDSSVTAALLLEAGHIVTGFTMRLWDDMDDGEAADVCAVLGIPHHTLDLQAEFKREIIDPFAQEYIAGLTPNPCIHCNARMKWGLLWKRAQGHGLQRLATGHYARIELDPDNNVHLRRGVDPTKDQSYFLWEIPPRLLKETLLPLGNLHKSEVRALAHQFHLPTAERAESLEICFIPDNDYRVWLIKRQPELAEGALSGEMVDSSGKVIGKHPGFPFFTIGQRKGLGLGGGHKYYVTRIDPNTRQVHLGNADDLKRSKFKVGFVNKLQYIPFDNSIQFEVKIRYRDPGVPAQVTQNSDDTMTIQTETPVNAVTSGQSAVIYLNDEVIAGGIILTKT